MTLQSREIDGDPTSRLAKQINKIYNYGHKISKRFTQADYSNTKAHAHTIKLAIYSNFSLLLSFSSTPLVLITVVSLTTLHKRPEALARYYVTSYWPAEWVKKLRWKTIELPSPTPPRELISILPVKISYFKKGTSFVFSQRQVKEVFPFAMVSWI